MPKAEAPGHPWHPPLLSDLKLLIQYKFICLGYLIFYLLNIIIVHFKMKFNDTLILFSITAYFHVRAKRGEVLIWE